MVAEIYPRMTSLIKNSKWRRDLLKGCIPSIVDSSVRLYKEILENTMALTLTRPMISDWLKVKLNLVYSN